MGRRALAALLGFQGLLESVALPGALDDVRPVGQPVQESRSEIGVPEYLGPVPEAEVAGDDHRAPLVALGQDLEQELGSFLGEGDVAQLIDDEQPVAGIALLDPLQILLLSGLDELVDQAAGGHEAGPDALTAGFYAQGGGQMGLASAAFAQKDYVLALFDILPAAELPDESPVQLRGSVEVKALHGLIQGEFGFLELSLEPVFGASLQLMFR